MYLVERHIKKKFLNQDKTPILKTGSEIQAVELASDNQKLYANLNKDAIIMLSKKRNEDKAFAFIHKNKNNIYYPVPLPDFTLCYFNFAYFMYKELNDSLSKLDFELSTQLVDVDCEEELFRFYGFSSAFVMHLFTSLESFVNSMIPDKERIYYKNSMIDRNEVIEKKPTIDKIKYVLSIHYNKKHFANDRQIKDAIRALKKTRDELVHMKYGSTPENSVVLFRKLLNFKYKETLNSVASLMNHYKPGYVEPCDCSKNI